MSEPRLTADDLRLWESWRLTALCHARTREFNRHMDAAKRVAGEAMAIGGKWAVMWSGGKDSTAMAHLLVVEMGLRLPLFSEKDDLDYPGEREYIETLAREWGADLRILSPDASLVDWVKENGRTLDGGTDIHGRKSELSKRYFYRLVEDATKDCVGIFLGLRAEESRGRNKNRASHGLLYRRKCGQYTAQPLGDWTGVDVYAYLFSRGIEVLPVYKCIALMHASEPWRVRKSWWVPGAAGRHGQVTWLRHYWPSLYEQIREWQPAIKALG